MFNSINQPEQNKLDLSNFRSGKYVLNITYYKEFNRILVVFLILFFILLFLPWTQNIKGQGNVTTLKPNQRPQHIQSPISGRIEQWFITEGDFVKKGDTILRLSEIKTEYFDDRLADRTNDQIGLKTQSIASYQAKVEALSTQIEALKKEQQLKLEQAELNIESKRMDFQAAQIKKTIAETQYNRIKILQNEGLKATKDLEEKRMTLQTSEAQLIAKQNALTKAEIELSRLNASYADKIAKVKSDINSAESLKFNTQAEVSKLENSYSNYTKRNALQFITSPQNGYINKALKGGIGETFKEGESLVTIMPADYELAVETYVFPIDLPLIHIGEKVRVQFDGWPAIVFSGWENVSYGTYGAKVVAIENFISSNGMYRVLLSPDQEDHQWPKGIRVGSGAKTIALLNDVPIWYEIWRQINGFPPDFYQPRTFVIKN